MMRQGKLRAGLSPVALLVSAAIIALSIAGCGGGSDGASASGSGSTITTSSLNKEEFIKRASKACQALREDIFEQVSAYLGKHTPEHPNRVQETTVFADMVRAVLLPIIRKEIDAIRELGAPAGDEDEVETMLTTEQEEVDSLAKLKHAVSRFQIERYFAQAAKLFEEYGLNECANGGA